MSVEIPPPSLSSDVLSLHRKWRITTIGVTRREFCQRTIRDQKTECLIHDRKRTGGRNRAADFLFCFRFLFADMFDRRKAALQTPDTCWFFKRWCWRYRPLNLTQESSNQDAAVDARRPAARVLWTRFEFLRFSGVVTCFRFSSSACSVWWLLVFFIFLSRCHDAIGHHRSSQIIHVASRSCRSGRLRGRAGCECVCDKSAPSQPPPPPPPPQKKNINMKRAIHISEASNSSVM
ncbi:hypothetical protein F2P81_008347 [Scophthalmus maximus]|uniref:Uncharacterized protein n=1 Tax=Scophthalmus maximus TaxID=52904 RepID=A0A6A4TD24_SCOMX|nr:hypothetical protein F2P81_008347 [Scophthalmus maximus]